MLLGHATAPTAACFSDDGSTLVTGSVDGSVKLWDVELGQELFTLPPCRGKVLAVAFRDDRTLTAAFRLEDEGATALHVWQAPRQAPSDSSLP